MRGLGLIIYGPEGIGKTSFGTMFPKPMTYIELKETGYLDLVEADLVKTDGIEHYEVTDFPTLVALLKESQGQRTVVIDSLSGFQQMYFDWCIDEFYDGISKKFFSYSEGPRRTAPQQLLPFETLLNKLTAKGTNVILLAHSKVAVVENPLGENYSQNKLDLDDGIGSVFTKWARAVLFLGLDVIIKGEKAQDKNCRMLYTEKAPGHMAKNRMNLKPYINCGESAQQAYDNFVKALPSAIKDHLNG